MEGAERGEERRRANHLESKSVGKKNKLGGSNNKEICFSSVRAPPPAWFRFSLSSYHARSRLSPRQTDASARCVNSVRARLLQFDRNRI